MTRADSPFATSRAERTDTAQTGPESLSVLQIGKFYPPYRGGMETHLQLLSESLQRTTRVEVVVSADSKTASRHMVNGVDVTRLGTSVRIAGASISHGMRRAIADSEADVVHLHLPNPTAILAYLASGRRGPLVVTYHSDIVRQKVLAAGFAPFLDRFLSVSDTIIVASPNYIESSPVLRRFRSRCQVIPFGIEAPSGDRDVAKAARTVRDQHGPRIILAVGRMVGYKGFEYLIDAMRQVDARLLLIGTGPLREALAARALRLGVADRVTMLGNVSDVTPFHHAADVFVLPSVSRAEAFGIVQLEAMAAGVPIVNTAVESGVTFVSPHNETGLTVAPRDADALAAAINTLLDDAALRERLGSAGRRRLETTFSVSTMVARTLDVYAAAIDKHRTTNAGAARSAQAMRSRT